MRVSGYLFSILLSLSAAAPAWADLKKHKPISCAAHDSFIDRIYNCGQNSLAVTFASQCANAMKKNAKENARELTALMNKLQAEMKSGQNKSMRASIGSLEQAIQVLDQQISELQANTDVVANYTQAMIDFPDGVDDESSAECFNSAFHGLQRIVNDLDQEIINSMQAREKAKLLLDQTSQNDSGLDSISPRMNTGTQPAPGAPRSPATRQYRQSDISGTEEIEKP